MPAVPFMMLGFGTRQGLYLFRYSATALYIIGGTEFEDGTIALSLRLAMEPYGWTAPPKKKEMEP